VTSEKIATAKYNSLPSGGLNKSSCHEYVGCGRSTECTTADIRCSSHTAGDYVPTSSSDVSTSSSDVTTSPDDVITRSDDVTAKKQCCCCYDAVSNDSRLNDILPHNTVSAQLSACICN